MPGGKSLEGSKVSRIRLNVIEGGLQTTFQDLGRITGRRYGIPPGGALDRAAHIFANRLVLNSPQAATLEMTLQGPRLYFETSALIAITGANFGPLLDNRPVPMWMSIFVRPGQTLAFSRSSLVPSSKFQVPSSQGVPGSSSIIQNSKFKIQNSKLSWGRVGYLAVHGGFDGPMMLGSRATYLKANLSGYRGLGRTLAAGDILESGMGMEAQHPLRHLAEGAGRIVPESERPNYSGAVQLRLLRGPNEENFSSEAYDLLFNSGFTLLEESDRMGFRLSGPKLPHRQPELAEIAASGTVFGAIQVPSNGQPIVLMADHQVTGGYPIIGAVLSADLPLLAQLLPGGEVSFIEA